MAAKGWGRRVAAVLALTLMASVGGVLGAGSAVAHHCAKPNTVGDVTVTIGGVATVGIDNNNLGTTDHDVFVCADPPHQESWVDVTDRNPGAAGVQVSEGTCGLAGCTVVDSIGVEVGLPFVTTDPPADGNSNVAVHLHTGSGICVWVLGAQTCVLGGGTYGGNQPLPDP